MEFQTVVNKRKMVRSFQDKEIPKTIIDRILQNAIHAPSAGFTQGWSFLVITDPERRLRYFDLFSTEEQRRDGRWPDLYNAPVLIAVCSSKKQYLDRYAEPDKGWTDRDESRWPAPFWHIDAGFAAFLILLTAVDQGLGGVFTGIRDPGRFKVAFRIPEEYTPIGMICLGYPAPDKPSPSLKRGRKPV